MDIKELVSVFTTGNAVQAEIVKNYLESEGIRAFVEGENQAAEPGLIGLEIKVQVAAGDADTAQKLVRAHEVHKHKAHGYETPKR